MILSHEEGATDQYGIENKASKYVIHVVNNDVHSVQDSYNPGSIIGNESCSKRRRQIVNQEEQSTSICTVDSIQSNFEAFTDMLLDKFQLSVI